MISLRDKAFPRVTTEIDEDEYIPRSNKTSHSRKWNSLGIGFLQYGMFLEALKVFIALTKREPENPATLNNFGVVLVKIGDVEGAKRQFEKAHLIDYKHGAKRAFTLPAWKNLQFVLHLQAENVKRRISVTQTSGGQALLSKSFWVKAFWSDFVIGGLLGGFLVSFVVTVTGLFESLVPGITGIASFLGLIGIMAIILYLYKKS